MLTAEYIQGLKRGNTSADTAKTKERVSEVWKSADKQVKLEALALAGQVRATVYRTMGDGKLSGKLAVSLAQSMNANPFYLSGESDERGECTAELLKKWLHEHGFPKVAKAGRKAAAIPAIETKSAPQPSETSALSTTPDKPQDFMDTLTEDDMVILLRSLLLRAKVDANCAKQVTNLKTILLS